MDTIVGRMQDYLSYKDIRPAQAEVAIGVSNGTLSKPFKNGTTIKTDTLEKFLNIYTDINKEWLLTGNNDMIKNKEVTPIAIPTYSNTGIPLLPFDAFAGIGDDSISGVPFSTIDERYVVPLFRDLKVDFMLPVRGSSMYPKYNSGDVVACMLIRELLFIQWQKVYVINTITQGTIMKRLKKSSSANCVLCISDNQEYDPFELPKDEIRSIALVVGVIRLV